MKIWMLIKKMKGGKEERRKGRKKEDIKKMKGGKKARDLERF